jgi:MYXO-CTERM domain-containing protein
MQNMKKNLLRGAAALAAAPVISSGAVIELWNFDDAAGTQFSSLTNSAGTASWGGDDPDVVTDGAGNLVFSQGTEANPDNVFRNATLGSPNVTTGLYAMEWSFTAATLATGDGAGANVGFGMRDEGGSDLFLVRLHLQSSTLRLQHRVGTTNTTLENFGVTTLSDLFVRVVADLDADTFDVYWQLGADPMQSSLGNAMSGTGLDFDEVRLAANTNVTDWGATDLVEVDYLSVEAVPEPSIALLGGLGLLGLLRRRR